MTSRLVMAMTLLVGIVAAALAVPLLRIVAEDQHGDLVSKLQVDTLAAASVLSSEGSIDWPATVQEVAAKTGARVVVVDANRSLMADSDGTSLDRMFERPEIDAALKGDLKSDVRPSTTLGEDLRFVAAPVVQNYDVVAAVRLSIPESEVNAAIARTARALALFIAAVVAAAAILAWVLARSIASPLRHLADLAGELPEDLKLRADEDTGPKEVRGVARALNLTAARLDSILQRNQRVAADASHHLRTPLTGIRLRLEAIEDESQQESVIADAQAATVEVDRLNRRIDQILDLARSDSGTSVSGRIDLTATIAERLDQAAMLMRDRGLQLTSSLAPKLSLVSPAGAVPRIVDELIGNAVQYAHSRIAVTLSPDDGYARIVVSDDGPGITPEERELVFERFARGNAAAPGGTGLGLALVRELAEAMGGTATAEASDLGGVAIVVRLPAD